MFVNSLQPGCFTLLNQRTERLVQGRMEVADVRCSRCNRAVGWKFCQDLTERQENESQVGRFGVVGSAVGEKRQRRDLFMGADAAAMWFLLHGEGVAPEHD